MPNATTINSIPSRQEDYYSLQAVFAAVDRADKSYDADPVVAKNARFSTRRRASSRCGGRKWMAGSPPGRGQPLLELDKKIAALPKAGKNGEAFGYHSSIEKDPALAKWVQGGLWSSVSLGSIVLHPCSDDFAGIGEGFGFPLRYKVELADDPEFKEGVALIGDFTGEDVPNPKLKPQSVDAAGRSGRYIRVTATKLALRQNDYIFALAELSALTAEGKNAAAGRPVTALDSIEAPARWRKSNLTDGFYPGNEPGR